MQNLLGSVALIAWPILAIYLFATKRLSLAILWTLMAAQMALPTGALIKFEMIPQFDKNSIPNLCVLIGCLVVAKRPLRIFNGFGLPELLIVCYLIGPIITSQLNGDAVVAGDRVIPGATLYDALSSAENAFIFIIPFFVGRQFLRTDADARDILVVLAMAGLVYSFPLLFEVRMSPTLQSDIYGFAATDFVMTARGGGYRPMAFMGSGLIASFFMMTTVVAATALWRTRLQLFRLPPSGLSAYLGGVLILCKSFGALLYGIVLIPMVKWTSSRVQMRVAVVLVSIALFYPMLRSFDLFPTQSLLQAISTVSEERKRSLDFRFSNEDKLLRRAFERPVFGWGRYGRSRVYNEESGRDESVTDGLWILTIGAYGLFGFVAQFGLLGIGVFRAAAALKLSKPINGAIFLSTIALIVAANIVEMIPNSGLLPWSWLLCGSLLGQSEALRVRAMQKRRQVNMNVDVASHSALKS